jgi:hypothetical protein
MTPEERFPGLAPFACAATLLHPQPGQPSLHDSHVGGPLLWPAGEPWPTCTGPHMEQEQIPITAELAESVRRGPAGWQELFALYPGAGSVTTTDEGHFVIRYVPRRCAPNAMVAVLQLRAADIPELKCPPGTDMLQMLWCPNDHAASGWGPRISLHWRSREAVSEVLAEQPVPHQVTGTEYVPQKCAVQPERVTDYPWHEELPRELADAIRTDGDFDQSSMRSPGWKVAGRAGWAVTDLIPMDCYECDTRMELLVTIASAEEQAGVQVGRYGDMRVFVCRECPDTPHRLDIQ